MTREQAETRLREFQNLFTRDHGKIPPVIMVGCAIYLAFTGGDPYSDDWNPTEEELTIMESGEFAFEGSLVRLDYAEATRDDELRSPIHPEESPEEKIAAAPAALIPGLDSPWPPAPPLEAQRRIMELYPQVAIADSPANLVFVEAYKEWGWAFDDAEAVAAMLLPDFLRESLPVVHLPPVQPPVSFRLN